MDKGKIEAESEGLNKLRKKNWVVYAKKPFGAPQTVLNYLGRYTHRVALSNDRILSVQSGEVAFSFSPRLIRLRRNRDRRDGDRKKTMTLDAEEFIRRFMLHVLPQGFMRIRHFGFLANRVKKLALPQCRKLLGLNPAFPQLPKRSAQDLLGELTGIDLSRCPSCKHGTMIVVAELPKISPWNSS